MHGFFSYLRDLLAPRGCVACDADVATTAAFCAPCAGGIVSRAGPVTRLARPLPFPVLSAFSYGGAVAEAVARFKFGGRSDLAEPLGALLAARLLSSFSRVISNGCVLVPVPSTAGRLRARGYNPAALLASTLGKCWNVRISHSLFRRGGDRPHQVGLSRRARLENAAGEFVCKYDILQRHAAGRSVLLVDDVVTTGATLGACAAAVAESAFLPRAERPAVSVVGAITLAAADI